MIELLRLYRIFYRYRIDEIVVQKIDLRILRLMKWLLPLHWFVNRVDARQSQGLRVRQALIEAGTIYVKFGQALSVRYDMLPAEICQQLALLRDDCPAFSLDQAKQVVQQQLGQSTQELFATFDERPLASASIAQVHAAELLDGREVVVKIVRPDIDQRIRQSINSLRSLAGLFEALLKDSKRLKPMAVVNEFAKVLENEKNMLKEASNATLIRHHFKGDTSMYVAAIYWDYTTERVLVMERVYGIPIHQTEELIKAGIDRRKLAENGVKIFLKQVFQYNLFHADMHPGNVFVDEQGVYKAIDFGIVGSLSNEDKLYMAENLLAFFNRDYRRVAELHIKSGWVAEGTRVIDLEATVRSVSEPNFGKPLGDLSMGQFLFQLLQVAKEFGMEVQPQLVLLQKTLFNIEGLGRELYPQLDLWQTAKPFLKNWLKKEFSALQIAKVMQQQVPYLRYRLPEKVAELVNTNNQQQSTQLKHLHHSVMQLQQLVYGLFMLGLALVLALGYTLWLQQQWLLYLSMALVVIGVWQFIKLFFVKRNAG